MTVDKWNEIRLQELNASLKRRVSKLENFGTFPKKTKFLCAECYSPVHDEAHIDPSPPFPRRQVTCTGCQKVDYRFLNDIEMVNFSVRE